MIGFPCFTSRSLHLEKCLQPKKPRCADNGEGCGACSKWCFFWIIDDSTWELNEIRIIWETCLPYRHLMLFSGHTTPIKGRQRRLNSHWSTWWQHLSVLPSLCPDVNWRSRLSPSDMRWAAKLLGKKCTQLFTTKLYLFVTLLSPSNKGSVLWNFKTVNIGFQFLVYIHQAEKKEIQI